MKEEKVILTLTTIPERLSFDHDLGLKRVIYSLINLKYNNYEIHFNIPKVNKRTGEEYVIPEWLKFINGREKLRIFRTEDYGPSTKLLPTLNRIDDPNQLIIIVDDDLIYESRLIESHLKLREKDDEKVWGFAGLNNLGDKFGDARDRFVIGVNKDVRVGIIEHYKTVSYRRRFFESDFNEEFLQKGWADDHLVSAYMGMKNRVKMVAASEYIPKHNGQDEWRKYGVVESFPVIKHSVTQSRKEGCNEFRKESEGVKIHYIIQRTRPLSFFYSAFYSLIILHSKGFGSHSLPANSH